MTPAAAGASRAAVVDTLAAWLDIDAERVDAALGEGEDGALLGALRCVPPGTAEVAARRLAMPVLRRVGDGGHWRLTTAAKGLRRALGQRLPPEARWPWVDAFHTLRAALGAEGTRWSGRRAAVCLTHDLDSGVDLQRVDALLDLERARGLRSTINVLTGWSYRIDPARLGAWLGEGFEVGLHGHEHDLALGYRTARAIRDELRRALAALPGPVRGFRAPALAASERLLAVVDELGFAWDSSLSAFDPSGRGVGTCFPYRYPGLELVEVPLTVQDSALFRDAGLSEESALRVTRRLLDRVVEAHGVFVLNTHPSITGERRRYYAGVLDALRDRREPVLVATLGEVVDLVNGRSRPQRAARVVR